MVCVQHILFWDHINDGNILLRLRTESRTNWVYDLIHLIHTDVHCWWNSNVERSVCSGLLNPKVQIRGGSLLKNGEELPRNHCCFGWRRARGEWHHSAIFLCQWHLCCVHLGWRWGRHWNLYLLKCPGTSERWAQSTRTLKQVRSAVALRAHNL